MIIDPLKAQKILVNLICIFLLTFSCWKILRNKRFHFPLTNAFIIANICANLFELLGTVSMGHTEMGSDALLYCFECGYYCSAIFATGCWFLNSAQIVAKKVFEKKLLLILIMLPLALHFILTVTTCIHHKIFYFNEAYQYVRGEWFSIFFGIAGLYILASACLYLYATLNKEIFIFKDLNRISFVYSVFLLVCMGLQMIINVALPIINTAAAIIAFLIHEDLQSKEITLDSLTNMNNRNAINERLLSILKHNKQNCYAIVLDVDSFKQINDKYGHLEGDKALININEAFQRIFGSGAFYGRLGGDEFVILIEDDSVYKIHSIEELINNTLKEISEEQNKSYVFTVTTGTVKIDDSMHTIPDVLSVADKRLYENKKAKHSRYRSIS